MRIGRFHQRRSVQKIRLARRRLRKIFLRLRKPPVHEVDLAQRIQRIHRLIWVLAVLFQDFLGAVHIAVFA